MTTEEEGEKPSPYAAYGIDPPDPKSIQEGIDHPLHQNFWDADTVYNYALIRADSNFIWVDDGNKKPFFRDGMLPVGSLNAIMWRTRNYLLRRILDLEPNRDYSIYAREEEIKVEKKKFRAIAFYDIPQMLTPGFDATGLTRAQQVESNHTTRLVIPSQLENVLKTDRPVKFKSEGTHFYAYTKP